MHLLSRKKKPSFDAETLRIIEHLSQLDPEGDDYKAAVSNLKLLREAGSYKQNDSPDGNTVITIVANLVGLLSIMKFEKIDILSAKALGWLIKLKT
jgi:hypothetical protein